MEDPVSEKKDGPKTMGEAFDEACPQYIAMGMTYDQFWNRDCAMVIPYRKAYRIRKEDENNFAWLQGMYIYEAICDVSPILHAFAKSGTRPRAYSDKPYDFRPQREKSAAETNQAKMDNAVAFMSGLAARFNKQRHDKLAKEMEAEAAQAMGGPS